MPRATPLVGTRQDAPAPAAATVEEGPVPVVAETPFAVAAPIAAAAAVLGGAVALRTRKERAADRAASTPEG